MVDGPASGDDRDFLTSLRRKAHDLHHRWLVLRRHGIRPQNIGELLGFVHYLSEMLQQTKLVRVRGAARSLEDRLRFHNNSMMPIGTHEQETLSSLFHNVHQTLDDELRGLLVGKLPIERVADEAPETDPVPPSPEVHDTSTSARSVFLLDQDSTTAQAAQDLLRARGYSVHCVSDSSQLAAAIAGAGSCSVIADLDHWPRDQDPIVMAGADATGSRAGPQARIQLLFLSADFSVESRLRGLRCGGHAVLRKPAQPERLLLHLAAWDAMGVNAPLKCLLVESDATRLSELRAAFDQLSMDLVSCPDLQGLPKAVVREHPDAVVMPWNDSAVSAPQVARILRQDQDELFLPVLFAVAPERAGESSVMPGVPNAITFDQAASADTIAQLTLAQAAAYREHSALQRIEQTRDLPTGLLQASTFERAVRQRMDCEPGEPGADVMALLHLEIDGYERWCNECTAEALTLLLARVAGAIASQLGSEDLAARLGDHRFAVFTPQPDLEAAAVLADRLRAAVAGLRDASPVKQWHLAASIGLCRLAADQHLMTLLNRARHLAHDARQLGGNRVQLEKVAEEEARSDEERQLWTERVRAAISENSFYLVFQPITPLAADKSIRRFEVFLRIRSDWIEQLDVAEFFRLAEEVRMSRWVDRWIVQQAIEMLVAHQQDEPDTHFFVKVSQATLQDPGFRDWLKVTLDRLRPRPGTLVLEVSAADVLRHHKRAQVLLEEMRSIQVPIAMEHLGVDEDAVSLLQELRPEFVKFQAAVTSGLSTDTHALERLHHVLALAKSRGIKTMAAYVEDANGLAMLWQSRFDLIQGSFLSHPEQELHHDINL